MPSGLRGDPPMCPAPVPGTRMSPKPRREKGRSHRASGEAFSLGTFRTMGSCGERRQHLQTSPSRQLPFSHQGLNAPSHV